ncbi:hypothetical protein [Zooshikella ganghwensis]|uniref:hypothetical protein n=1 Tax=Zooshikella ganghwensis TaxID=202772 RepID=UPI000485EC6F|nr:hypothetical protein [Zooshikella ganghwensis]
MNVSHVLSIEKLRDGGSLVVSFQADDSCEYWLMLPINISNGASEGYLPPVLVNRTTGIEIDLSWSGAKSWLQLLESYIEEADYHLFNAIRSTVRENT